MSREQIKKFGWWMFNVSYEGFMELMAKNGIDYKPFIEAKWDEMRNDPLRWWMNLDESLQQAVLDAVVEKYGE